MITAKFVHPLNDLLPMAVTDAGIVIDSNFVKSENIKLGIVVTPSPIVNVNVCAVEELNAPAYRFVHAVAL